MSVSQDPRLTIKNRLLAALPASEYQRLAPHLELVSLSRDQVLYAEGELISHVYFLNQGLVSLVWIMENGEIVEVGLVAKEGMVGMPVCWGGHLRAGVPPVKQSDREATPRPQARWCRSQALP